jgi:TolB protein
MIIYASDVGGKGVLSTVSTDGATRSRLSGLSGNIREPAWGPILK